MSSPDASANLAWSFRSERKAAQAARRGWTVVSINAVLAQPALIKQSTDLATGDAATIYYRADGHYVVRHDATGHIIQVSNTHDPHWIDPHGDPLVARAQRRTGK